jgi:hypothetical protein
MKRLVPAVLLCILGIVALNAKNTKQSLRVELAERQRLLAYSLVDPWGSNGEAYVASVEGRTFAKVKAKDIQKLTSEQGSSPEGRYSVFYKNAIWLRDNASGETKQVANEKGEFSRQCFSPEGKFVYSTGKTAARSADGNPKEAFQHKVWSGRGLVS